jgi:hypothetical protein
MLSRLKEIYAAYRPQQRHKFDVGYRHKKTLTLDTREAAKRLQ